MNIRVALSYLYAFSRSSVSAVILIVYLLIYFIITSLLDIPLVTPGIAGRVLFGIPLGLFILNLLVCTISRIAGNVKAGTYGKRLGWLRAGPDLVHGAILLAIIAGVVSLHGRIEGAAVLGPGDTVRINRDYSLVLVDFEEKRYEDGSPKSWVSTVDVKYRGRVVRSGEQIRVNHPIEVQKVTIYQSSYRETEGGLHTVLTAVYDPSLPIIRAALGCMGLGICLIFIWKAGGSKRWTRKN